MIPGHATAEGTARFADRARAAGRFGVGHYRTGWAGLTVSSIGLGTYLGRSDAAEDDRVTTAAGDCLAAGVNLLDTAINYRNQRGERSLGAALARSVATGLVRRDEVVVCSKLGYLPFDGTTPPDRAAWLRDTYVRSGIIGPADLVAGSQCVAPRYVADQIARSRRNLGLACVDLMYLHNAEYMRAPLGAAEWATRMRAAFEVLERAADAGEIGAYGVATWDGFRVGPGRPEHLELEELLALARQAAGGRPPRFAAVQAPLSCVAREAAEVPTQTVAGRPMTLLQAGAALGVTIVASAPLLQGKALPAVPAEWTARPGIGTPARAALQWVRTRPGLTTVLVGMKDAAHVRENLALAAVDAR